MSHSHHNDFVVLDEGAVLFGRERKIVTAANNYPIPVAGSRRPRRRGPRSDLAVARRRLNGKAGTPFDTASGESEAPVSEIGGAVVSQPFLIYSINIQCLLSILTSYVSTSRTSLRM